jgi:hypothetical protein
LDFGAKEKEEEDVLDLDPNWGNLVQIRNKI